MERPEVRYAENDGVSIAYTRWGSGDQVLVYVAPWVSNVELVWDLAEFRRSYERAGRALQVIEIDKRGVGLSDRTGRAPTPDDRVADTLAVLDAEGVQRVSLLGASEAAATAVALAARHSERVERLVLAGPTLPGIPTEDLLAHASPDDPPFAGLDHVRETMETWGTDARALVRYFYPTAVEDQRVLAWAERFQRQSASPGALAAHLQSAMTADILADLDQVECPVFIGHSSGDLVVPVACTRYLAAVLPDATVRIWESPDHVSMFSPNWAAIQDDILEFVTGTRPVPVSTSRFAAVAFTDIVDSTSTSTALGDDAWERLVRRPRHHHRTHGRRARGQGRQEHRRWRPAGLRRPGAGPRRTRCARRASPPAGHRDPRRTARRTGPRAGRRRRHRYRRQPRRPGRVDRPARTGRRQPDHRRPPHGLRSHLHLTRHPSTQGHRRRRRSPHAHPVTDLPAGVRSDMADHATPALLATTVDCVDLEGMTGFWGTLLGVEHQVHEPFGFLAPTEGRRATIWVQRVPEARVGKNRVHLDFVVRDLDAACERVVELGGSLGERRSWQDFHWRTCLDPEGNEFDIMQAQEPPPAQG